MNISIFHKIPLNSYKFMSNYLHYITLNSMIKCLKGSNQLPCIHGSFRNLHNWDKFSRTGYLLH